MADLVDLQKRHLGVPAPLRDYQWEGVSFLFRHESALLADEMGLGKTVQAAVALALVLREPDVNRALVVAPAPLALNWERELAKWAPNLVARRLTGGIDERTVLYQLPVDVLIASYEQIRTDALDRIRSGSFDVVVLDEAQRIKNKDSQTAFACRLLPRRRAWAMSATPLENSRGDLESVVNWIRPGLVSSNTPREVLHERVGPFFLRRKKADVLPELPPVIIQDVPLDLASRQRAAYDEVWESRHQVIENEEKPVPMTSLFALLTKLKQLCNYDPASGESSKLDALGTIVESLSKQDDKIIVFSQYVETLRWISERLQGVKSDIYHGGLGAMDRDAILATFQEQPGPRLLLTSLRAGGVGLNIQAASAVVLFDRWWNPAVEIQAIFRAHRFDRNRPLHVFRYLVCDSVEERIDEILQQKQEVFEEYVEASPNGAVAEVTRGELVRILGLTRAEVV